MREGRALGEKNEELLIKCKKMREKIRKINETGENWNEEEC